MPTPHCRNQTVFPYASQLGSGTMPEPPQPFTLGRGGKSPARPPIPPAVLPPRAPLRILCPSRPLPVRMRVPHLVSLSPIHRGPATCPVGDPAARWIASPLCPFPVVVAVIVGLHPPRPPSVVPAVVEQKRWHPPAAAQVNRSAPDCPSPRVSAYDVVLGGLLPPAVTSSPRYPPPLRNPLPAPGPH